MARGPLAQLGGAGGRLPQAHGREPTIRIAERDEAAVLSLAYFLTPFTVTSSEPLVISRLAAIAQK